MDHLIIRRNGRPIVRVPVGDIGAGLSPFPFILSFPQDDHERLLVAQLARARVTVERGTELVGLTQDGDRVRASLRHDGREDATDFAYVCGCDGARSTVRQALGADFPGGTYGQVFYVADVYAKGAAITGGVNGCLNPDGFALVLPVRSSGALRLIGIVPAAVADKDPITYDDIAPEIARQTGLTVETVNWFSTYRVHHRVVDHFRHGRVFLAGDAAHIHSPVGGQGMNTGIGDAVNLAWKLASVVQGRGSTTLLDTYEPERLAFARSLVATTDRLFAVFAGRSWAAWVARGYLIPRAAAVGFNIKRVQRFLFRAVSQTRIQYHDSPLSTGAAGKIRGGDRLPWVPGTTGGRDGDNFEPLSSVDWQIHVYGAASAALRAATERRGLDLQEFPWNDRAEAAGLVRDAAYLVRPDGYVAVAQSAQDVGQLEQFLARFDIAPSRAAEAVA
jgi:2-polyprenyl-6-methoxyphenol hydroxylase-like FAD-dependent oxidoreductase